MSEIEREIGGVAVGLTADTVATAIILVGGVAYLMMTVLAPKLIGNVPTPVSMVTMFVIGVCLLWSVYRGSRILFALLALVEIGIMVGSLVGTIRWTVPYDSGLAAVSMVAMNFVVAVALVYRTIHLTGEAMEPVPE